MTRVLILSVVLGICCALAEKSDTTTTERPKGLANSEDRFLTNIIHGKNSSGLGDADEEEKKTEKKPRTVLHRLDSNDRGSSCCGSKYTSNGSARPDYNKVPLETGRYPSQYGERQPIDRYGWQTQGRPPGPIGGRPGGGSGVYAGSQLGDRYGPRPVHPSASETANRPSALGYGSGFGYGVSGYGGYGRPTGHGISGTLADGDEFGHSETAYPEAQSTVPQGNIQAQKAIALKALAGVALIGAAAALASNPVLLPIGIMTGRRKRSESFSDEEQTDYRMDYILYMLKENLAKIQREGSSDKLIVSPRCVARLTCEIQKDYLSDLGKDVEILNANRRLPFYLTNLIRDKVLNTNTVNADVKNLIKLAVGVAAENESCAVFNCNYIKKV